MSSLLSSAPLPAITLAIGCVAGMMGSHYSADDSVTQAPAPSAAMASAGIGAGQTVDDQAAAAASDASGRSKVARASDGLFYIGAEVNGHHLRFLVDTGASYTVLRADDARTLGLTPEADRFGEKVETVGGSTAMAWTHLASVKLAGRELHDVRAAVVRQGLGVSLLGQNMLTKLGSVRIKGDRLELN
ncbi:aspartyl protease family protein [Sphingomonas vulcanisoli]|uniref:Aspartyl protease family protein n=1 Tax=Sphingomonas vulcanisoli TaxID=1658060 RepID=A0ABX0TPW5_9SPHN|nr:retropepsin-like aspartic protease [Sphingomonas vulcanisoli]NIJ07547.1 aspartyl protease family protein [Sphingomonas vulcanisoli]